MPDLMDKLYCSEQIHIPPTFPFIMKLYCKAAIRTQPYDLLKWSAAYFRALANGEEPPVKDRIEYPPYDSPTGLTPGYIKILVKQLGKNPETVVSAGTVFAKWNCACLEDELLVKLVALMGARTSFSWLKFVAVAAGFISNTLTNTMVLLCELLTDEPEGGMATIPLEVFSDLYLFLAELECGPLTAEEKKRFEDVEFLEDASAVAEKIRMAAYEASAEGESLPEGLIGEREERSAGQADYVVVPEEDDATDGGREATARQDRAPTVAADAGAPVTEAKEPEEIGGTAHEGKMLTEELPFGGGSGENEKAIDPEGLEEEDAGSALTADAEERTSEEEVDVVQSTTGNLMDGDLVTKKEPSTTDANQVGEPETKTEERPEQADKKTEEATEAVSDAREMRRIKMADVEESIRRKIEERMEETSQSGQSDDFEELGSYLLDAAARLKKYTAEEMGFAIFRRYMRQEVPGIGPKLDAEQVEKVLDFMDYSASKQKGMVMPRNIRHWMCPPLDKVLLQEP